MLIERNPQNSIGKHLGPYILDVQAPGVQSAGSKVMFSFKGFLEGGFSWFTGWFSSLASFCLGFRVLESFCSVIRAFGSSKSPACLKLTRTLRLLWL